MSEDPMILSEIGAILRRRKYYVAIPALVILLLSGALAYLLPPVYLSTATVLIEQQEIPRDMVESTVTGYANERIEMIRSRVMTRDNLWAIAEKFDLYPGQRSPETKQDIVARMREEIVLQMVSTDIVDPKSGKPISATIAFSLSYESDTPELAQLVAAEVAELFLDENRRSRTERAQETSAFLDQEAKRLDAQISKLEGRLVEFKNKNANYLPETIQATRSSLENARQLRDQLSAKVDAAEGRREYLRGRLSGFGLTGQLARARAELATAREKYSDIHPDVLRLTRVVDSLEAQQAQGGGAGSGDLYAATSDSPEYLSLQRDMQQAISDSRSGRAQLEDINRKIADYESRIAKSPEVEREFSSLTRDLESARQNYREMLDKLMGAQLAEELERGQKAERFTLIERANLPSTPIRPNRLGVMLLGVILALGVSVGIAALAEYLDQRIHGPRDLAAVFKAPPLAMIPEIPVPRGSRRLAAKLGAIVVIVAAAGVMGTGDTGPYGLSLNIGCDSSRVG